MHIKRLLNRNSTAGVLLGYSYQEDLKLCKRTLVNFSKLLDNSIEGLQFLLKSGTRKASSIEALKIQRFLTHDRIPTV